MIHFNVFLAILSGFCLSSKFGLVLLLFVWFMLDACPNIINVILQRIEMIAPPREEKFQNHHADAENIQWINQILETCWKKIVIWMNVKMRPILNKYPPVNTRFIYIEHLDFGDFYPQICGIKTVQNHHSIIIDLDTIIELNTNLQLVWWYPFLKFGLKNISFNGVIRIQMKLCPNGNYLKNLRISLVEISHLDYHFTRLASLLNFFKPLTIKNTDFRRFLLQRSIFSKNFYKENQPKPETRRKYVDPNYPNQIMIKILETRSSDLIITPKVFLQISGQDFKYHTRTGHKGHVNPFHDVITIPLKNFNIDCDKILIKLVDCGCEDTSIAHCFWNLVPECICHHDVHQDQELGEAVIKLVDIPRMMMDNQEGTVLNLNSKAFGNFEIIVEMKLLIQK